MDKFLYQFHTHTEYSSDCNLKLKILYKKLKDLGISGIAITDHNTIEGAKEFEKTYGYDIQVIIGEEIMTTQGEIIGLFLNEEITKGLSPEQTIQKIKSQGGVVYIPHPFDENRHRTCLKKDTIINNLNDIDVIEAFNGRVININNNNSAYKFAEKVSKPIICGSDSHSAYELGFNIMGFESRKINKENFIQEISKAEFINLNVNEKVHLYTKYVKFSKLMKEGNFSELYEIILRKYKSRLSKFR